MEKLNWTKYPMEKRIENLHLIPVGINIKWRSMSDFEIGGAPFRYGILQSITKDSITNRRILTIVGNNTVNNVLFRNIVEIYYSTCIVEIETPMVDLTVASQIYEGKMRTFNTKVNSMVKNNATDYNEVIVEFNTLVPEMIQNGWKELVIPNWGTLRNCFDIVFITNDNVYNSGGRIVGMASDDINNIPYKRHGKPDSSINVKDIKRLLYKDWKSLAKAKNLKTIVGIVHPVVSTIKLPENIDLLKYVNSNTGNTINIHRLGMLLHKMTLDGWIELNMKDHEASIRTLKIETKVRYTTTSNKFEPDREIWPIRINKTTWIENEIEENKLMTITCKDKNCHRFNVPVSSIVQLWYYIKPTIEVPKQSLMPT